MFPQSNLSYADYRDWKTLNRSFDSLSAYQRSGMTLTAAEGAQRVPAARVSDDFFRTLGVAPILGRDFRAGEDLPSAARTVLLSYAAWQARYGGAPNVLGESVTLNGAPHVIVGVLPRHFHFAPAEPADFWVDSPRVEPMRPPAELPQSVRRRPAQGRCLDRVGGDRYDRRCTAAREGVSRFESGPRCVRPARCRT